MLRIMSFLFSLCLLVVLGCGRSEDEGSRPPQAAPAAPQVPASSEPQASASSTVDATVMKKGKQVYTTYCLSCHQKNGQGVPNLNPPLVGTAWVLQNETRLIGVILNGLNEEIEVNGEVYHNAMGAFANLSDTKIAAVLTYIRNSWGNQAAPIRPERVAEVRAHNQG